MQNIPRTTNAQQRSTVTAPVDPPPSRSDGPIFREVKRPQRKPGVYQLLCTKAAQEIKFRRKVAHLTFLDPLANEEFHCYLNLRRVGKETKFYEAWVAANDGRPPYDGDRMSLSVFAGNFFAVEIGDTVRGSAGKFKKGQQGYATVRRVLQKVLTCAG